MRTNYSFKFTEDNTTHIEKVFGLEVSLEVKVILSEEHTEFKWIDGQIAVNHFLKYSGNKKGITKVMEYINNL